jgi:hypothetical protein
MKWKKQSAGGSPAQETAEDEGRRRGGGYA